jgi:hypothetical protein
MDSTCFPTFSIFLTATAFSGGTMGALFSGLSMVKLVDFFDLDLSNYSGL